LAITGKGPLPEAWNKPLPGIGEGRLAKARVELISAVVVSFARSPLRDMWKAHGFVWGEVCSEQGDLEPQEARSADITPSIPHLSHLRGASSSKFQTSILHEGQSPHAERWAFKGAGSSRGSHLLGGLAGPESPPFYPVEKKIPIFLASFWRK
jgi:hypothetical protein